MRVGGGFGWIVFGIDAAELVIPDSARKLRASRTPTVQDVQLRFFGDPGSPQNDNLLLESGRQEFVMLSQSISLLALLVRSGDCSADGGERGVVVELGGAVFYADT